MKKFINSILVTILIIIATTLLSSCSTHQNNEQNLITISFNSNGGTYLESIKIEKGSKIPKPENCIKKGYTLDGWYIDNEEWSFVGYIATEDMCLNAKWSIITYFINYELAGGSRNGISYPEKYTIEDSSLQISIPFKHNCVFDGWYLDSDYNNRIDYVDCSLCQNITLYAKWIDTFVIDSEEELLEFINNEDLWDNKVRLNKDIDLGNKIITPIGSQTQRFKGTFDGNGYKVSNFVINSNSDYIGFFGYAVDCFIENLRLVNCKINKKFDGNKCCGCLVGYLEGDSTIKNCCIENANVEIDNTNYNLMFNFGAMVGKLLADYSTINILNCYTTGNIKVTNGTAGGLIGYLSSLTYNSFVNIKNSYSTCNIETNHSCGGLVGYGTGCGIALENCFSTGNLSSSSSKLYSSRLGSIIRYLLSDEITISNCYSTIDREFTEQGEPINYQNLYDSQKILFENPNNIYNNLKQIWGNEWDFSADLPILKIFIN